MNNIEYTNFIANKYNAITEKEYNKLPYGVHFGYAKTIFTKGGVSCSLYVPHQKPENTYDESAFESHTPQANLNTREVMQFDPSNSFQIGDNLKGGI